MKLLVLIFSFFLFAAATNAQTFTRDFPVAERPQIEIVNARGQVRVLADENLEKIVSLAAASPGAEVEEKDLTIAPTPERIQIVVASSIKRIDLTIRVPARSRLKITGEAGEIEVGGNLESAAVATDTGTIYAQVPLDRLKYNFLWTQSRPRYLSDPSIAEPKEKAGGKFVVSGKLPDDGAKKEGEKGRKGDGEKNESDDSDGETADGARQTADEKIKNQKSKIKNQQISLDFTTKRGIILLNVPPAEVPSDVRDRELTRAAKAIIASGDRVLTDAIRKVSPRKFGDYAKTLPMFRGSPTLQAVDRGANSANGVDASVKRVNVSVTDRSGRAVNNLKAADFAVFEAGEEREILAVEPTSAPFNLVLLLDVSGSVEERIDFIRKAARNFINTTGAQDRLAVTVFRDDVQPLADFTIDKQALSASLDKFDAGGSTAVYDSIAFSLVETIKPLRGERTAIVILSDGDDNRSFVPFDSLLGAIEESGALVYPLYVPSGLIPAGSVPEANQSADPLRSRYLTVTTKAEGEAKRLAEASGGAYFPIRRLEDLQKAYDDVTAQLRTAYTVEYRSKAAPPENANLARRPRVAVKRDGAFVRLGTVTSVPQLKSRLEPKIEPENPKREIKSVFRKINFAPESIETEEITGEIKAIKYKLPAAENLKEFGLENFDVNRAPPAFVLKDAEPKIAVSRWVSPKRTRSYPYERMYNTLAHKRRAAVIPIVKDEGANGERDFLQWDTVSLLNLLEVHAVFAFYNHATKSPRAADRLTDQQFDRDFVRAKLTELTRSNLSANEWNLRELKSLPETLRTAKTAYQKISEQTGVRLHAAGGLENFERKLSGDLQNFLIFSREKAAQAQRREFLTDQPKETTPTTTKSRITITDYLGGKYFFTVDEAITENGVLYLIESKHNQDGKLTGASDIKDGLVKMILYRNLSNVRQNGKPVKFMPVLRLTASEMQNAITSEAKDEDLTKFIELNRFDRKQAELLSRLFNEARQNGFLIKVEQASISK